MLCYRDMTFCNSENHLPDCRRQLTSRVIADAEAWWGNKDAPIAVSPLCDGRRATLEKDHT